MARRVCQTRGRRSGFCCPKHTALGPNRSHLQSAWFNSSRKPTWDGKFTGKTRHAASKHNLSHCTKMFMMNNLWNNVHSRSINPSSKKRGASPPKVMIPPISSRGTGPPINTPGLNFTRSLLLFGFGVQGVNKLVG